jgi:hypothetical protein
MNLPKQATPIIRNRLARFSRSGQVSGMSMTGILPSQCVCQPTGNGGCTLIANNCPFDPQANQQVPATCIPVKNDSKDSCVCKCGVVSTPLNQFERTIGVLLP